MAKPNTAVIYGSARKDRQGIKAARFMVRQLKDRGHNSRRYSMRLTMTALH